MNDGVKERRPAFSSLTHRVSFLWLREFLNGVSFLPTLLSAEHTHSILAVHFLVHLQMFSLAHRISSPRPPPRCWVNFSRYKLIHHPVIVCLSPLDLEIRVGTVQTSLLSSRLKVFLLIFILSSSLIFHPPSIVCCIIPPPICLFALNCSRASNSWWNSSFSHLFVYRLWQQLVRQNEKKGRIDNGFILPVLCVLLTA